MYGQLYWDDPQVDESISTIQHLIDNCLGKMNGNDYEKIQERFETVKIQSDFWLKEDNCERFVYDLRQFATWLCDFIGEKEREFWGHDEES